MSYFTSTDIYLNDSDQQLAYFRRNKDQKKAIHWGQRKLIMSEIQFLTEYSLKKQESAVIYIGAAPGNHIPLLSQMFSHITFYLYDPQPFHIQETDKIKIFQRYFTDDDALNWNKDGVLRIKDQNTYLISDIRTADHLSMELEENETTIMSDMLRQKEWYLTINPTKALLKFRLPYSDFKPETTDHWTFNYLNGKIYKQAWAPQTSTETRLVPEQGESVTDWDVIKYESQLFYHNTVVREKNRYLNLITGKTNPMVKDELLNDYDSMLESYILLEYIKKYKVSSSLSYYSDLITKELNKGRVKKNWYSLSKLRLDPILIKRRYQKVKNT